MRKDKLIRTKQKVGYNLLIKEVLTEDPKWVSLKELFLTRTEAHLHKNEFYPSSEYRIVGVRIDTTPLDVLLEFSRKNKEKKNGKSRKNKS